MVRVGTFVALSALTAVALTKCVVLLVLVPSAHVDAALQSLNSVFVSLDTSRRAKTELQRLEIAANAVSERACEQRERRARQRTRHALAHPDASSLAGTQPAAEQIALCERRSREACRRKAGEAQRNPGSSLLSLLIYSSAACSSAVTHDTRLRVTCATLVASWQESRRLPRCPATQLELSPPPAPRCSPVRCSCHTIRPHGHGGRGDEDVRA